MAGRGPGDGRAMTTTVGRWQQGDSSQTMAAGRRLGKATARRYLLQDDGRAVTEQGGLPGRAMAVGRAAAAAGRQQGC